MCLGPCVESDIPLTLVHLTSMCQSHRIIIIKKINNQRELVMIDFLLLSLK